MPERYQKEIEKGLAKIERLDIKQRELQGEADAILQSSGVGQAPPVYHATLDKAIKITEQKAIIWNGIRNNIIKPTNKTLWQIAIANKLTTVWYGEEKHLDFYAEDIKRVLNA